MLVSAALLAVPLLSAPAVSAAPATAAPQLCDPDIARGGVPAAFPVEACVDGTGMTLRNDRDRPVVVTGTGDLGGGALLHTEDDARADVVRRTSPSAVVLLPGEVARWPIGPGQALLTVGPLPVPSAPEIATVLGRGLDGESAEEATGTRYDSAGALVAEVAAAARARAACVAGRTFLGMAACDVTAAAAIGSATAEHLDRRTAEAVLPRLLDPAAWATWPLADPDWPAGADVTLRQEIAPGSVPPGPPVPPAGSEASRAQAVAAPSAPATRPAPAAERTSAPARPPASTAAPAPATESRPTPAPAPEPLPAPAPVLPPLPVPVRPPVQVLAPQVELPSWQEIQERNMARLRELAAAWAEAREQAEEQDRDDDRGRGRGNR